MGIQTCLTRRALTRWPPSRPGFTARASWTRRAARQGCIAVARAQRSWAFRSSRSCAAPTPHRRPKQGRERGVHEKRLRRTFPSAASTFTKIWPLRWTTSSAPKAQG
jgi:hypothetical protein